MSDLDNPSPSAPVPVPDNLHTYVPMDLIQRWQDNGGCLVEADFRRDGTRKNDDQEGPYLNEYEHAQWVTYKRERREREWQQAGFVEDRRREDFEQSEQGRQERAEYEQQETRERIDQMLRLEPFFAFVRRALPNQSEFLSWMTSNEGSEFLYGVIIGRQSEHAESPDDRSYTQPINRVGGGFLLRASYAKIENMATILGVRVDYDAHLPSAQIRVAEGFLNMAAHRMRKKDLLRGYDPFKSPGRTEAEDEPWSASIPELAQWNEAIEDPKPRNAESTSSEVEQAMEMASESMHRGLGEAYRIAVLLLRDVFWEGRYLT